jgi:hypothetical protein
LCILEIKLYRELYDGTKPLIIVINSTSLANFPANASFDFAMISLAGKYPLSHRSDLTFEDDNQIYLYLLLYHGCPS